jgi:hypothetical protein
VTIFLVNHCALTPYYIPKGRPFTTPTLHTIQAPHLHKNILKNQIVNLDISWKRQKIFGEDVTPK